MTIILVFNPNISLQIEMAFIACRSLISARRCFSGLKAVGGHSNSEVLRQVKMIPSVYPVREMAKKTKNKAERNKKVIAVDDLISDIDLEDEDEEFEQSHFKETDLSKFMSQKSKGKKTKGAANMKYEEFIQTVNGELLWKELQEQIDNLKHAYLHQFSVRSATSLGKNYLLRIR